MKCIFFIVLISLIPGIIFSQKLDPSDSLIIGKDYRLILFDEEVFTGKLISQDNKNLNIKSGSVLMVIERDNILNISTDLSPMKYKFLATLNYGTIPGTNEYGGYKSNFIINGRFSYFFSEKNNIGIDFSVTSFRENENDYYYYYSQYDLGKITYTDILINAQAGNFEKDNIVDVYLNLGFGLHIFHMSSSYYTYYDPGYGSYENSARTKIQPMLQIGGGLIIKPFYNIGINIEADLQGYGFQYLLIPYEVAFPFKVGVSYYFMK